MPPSLAPSSAFQPSHWDPIVIALVIIICAIFLLFSYHRILQRHCRGFSATAFSRNPNQSRRLNEENPDSPSLQFQSQGLDSFVMHSLPIIQFKKKNKEELCQGNTDCAVCLGEFEDGEWLKHLPNCCHMFHVSCIDTWFQTHSSCPLCRSFVCNQARSYEHSGSTYTLQETLRREDIHQQRSQNYQILQSQTLQSPPLRMRTQVEINIHTVD